MAFSLSYAYESKTLHRAQHAFEALPSSVPKRARPQKPDVNSEESECLYENHLGIYNRQKQQPHKSRPQITTYPEGTLPEGFFLKVVMRERPRSLPFARLLVEALVER